MSYYAVVWLDHQTAKIFSLRRDGFTLQNLAGVLPHGQTHIQAGNLEGIKPSRIGISLTPSSMPSDLQANG